MYESDQSTVTQALENANPAVFTDETIAQILALTTAPNSSDTTVKIETVGSILGGTIVAPADAEVLFVTAPVLPGLEVVVQGDAPVVAFQGTTGVTATITAGANTPPSEAGVVDRIVVGSAGADKIVIADNLNSKITVGNNDTVVAGGGNDTIVAGQGNAVIVGGTGNAIVQLGGKESDYTVTVNNGRAIVTGGGSVTDISKIQFVQLDNGKALVFANSQQQAAVTTLFETTFGRTASAAELKTWFDKAAAGMSLETMAKEFAATTEFKAITDAQNSTDYVNGLYLRTFGRAAEAGGMEYWRGALDSGLITREQLVYAFAEIAGQNLAGTAAHQEADVVGSVTIVHNII